MILEKDSHISTHPKAHYISPRTVEIFNNLELLLPLDSYLKDRTSWSQYRYCNNLLADEYIAEKKHFDDEKSFRFVEEISDAAPLHIGQHKLNEELYQKHPEKDIILFNTQFKSLTQNDNCQSDFKYKIQTFNGQTIHTKYLIGCDGSHSLIRNLLNIETKGDKNLHSFVNVHFFSKFLSNKLKERKNEAMLHFIFNTKIVCVFNNL